MEFERLPGTQSSRDSQTDRPMRKSKGIFWKEVLETGYSIWLAKLTKCQVIKMTFEELGILLQLSDQVLYQFEARFPNIHGLQL